MGLLFDIILAPITGPVKGFVLILKQLHAHVQRELYNESRLQKKLLNLRMNYERGKLEKEEYKKKEKELLDRLKEVRKRQEKLLEEAGKKTSRLSANIPGGMQVEILEDEENE